MFSIILKTLRQIHQQLCQSGKLLPTVISQLNLNEALNRNEPLEINYKQLKKLYFVTKDGRYGVLYKQSKEGDLFEGKLEDKGIGVKPSQYWNRFGENMNKKANADIARIIYVVLK